MKRALLWLCVVVLGGLSAIIFLGSLASGRWDLFELALGVLFGVTAYRTGRALRGDRPRRERVQAEDRPWRR